MRRPPGQCDHPHGGDDVIATIWMTTRREFGMNFGIRLCTAHALNMLHGQGRVLGIRPRR